MAPSPSDLLRSWTFEPGVVIGIALPALWYAHGVRSLWRSAGHGRGVGTAQISAFAAGLVTLVVALVSPLDAMGDDLFSAHMVQHLLLILVAAPLLVLGKPELPALWSLPASTRKRVGRWWNRSTATRNVTGTLASPGVAWALHIGALLFWHMPAPYGWALENEGIHAMEHASFLGTAILFWWAVLQPTGRRRLSYGASVLYVSAAGAVMGALGAILTFSPSPWYVGHLTTTAAWNLTPLQDQQLAGLIMWIPASVVYLGAACWSFVQWIGPDAPNTTQYEPEVPPLRARGILIGNGAPIDSLTRVRHEI